MAWAVYTRARARLIQIKATTTTYTLYYLRYILHLLGFGRSVSCARVIHYGPDRTPENRDAELCVTSHRSCGFVHNSITEFVAPNLSYPQAHRWKQAKTKTPTSHLAAPVKSARRQHGRSGGMTPRKRWNDAVGTALAYGPGGKNEPPSTHGRHPQVFDAERPRRRRAKTFHGGITQKPSMGGPSQAMAEPSRRRPAGDASAPWLRQRSRRNQKRASLRAFRRWEVKVLGFGVRARLRPQRMASRGCPDPFALVGAIGEACGEAPGVLFSGTPPCGWGVFSFDVGGRCRFWAWGERSVWGAVVCVVCLCVGWRVVGAVLVGCLLTLFIC